MRYVQGMERAVNVIFALGYCTVIVPMSVELGRDEELEEREEDIIDEAVEHAMQSDGLDVLGAGSVEVEPA